MINLKYDGATYKLPNRPNELTIKEFEKITSLLNDDNLTNINKWILVLSELNIPIEVIEDIEPSAFIEIIKNFNTITNGEKFEIIKELKVKNVVYKLQLDDNGKPKFKVKDISIIEEAIIKNKKDYLSTIMAVAYKRDEVDKNIQYDKAHLKFKKELFSELTADIVIPLLSSLGVIFIKDFEIINKNE